MRDVTSIQDSHPQARSQGLVVEEVDGEILIYDVERDKAHCLNQMAAQIWRLCDGKHRIREIKAALPGLDAGIDDIVVNCLQQFRRLHLLEEESLSVDDHHVFSRRQLLKKIGLGTAATAALLPLITSITAPPAAAATSLHGCGATCNNNSNCSGNPSCPNCLGPTGSKTCQA